MTSPGKRRPLSGAAHGAGCGAGCRNTPVRVRRPVQARLLSSSLYSSLLLLCTNTLAEGIAAGLPAAIPERVTPLAYSRSDSANAHRIRAKSLPPMDRANRFAAIVRERSFMRWLVRIGVLLLVLAGLVVVALMLVPGDRIARIAEQRFEAATGRSMTLSGDIRATIHPQPGIRIGQVEVANADWSQAGPMLTADSARVGVDLRALIGGTVRIRRVEIVNPVLRLETAADGRTNWDFKTPDDTGAGTRASGSPLPAFSLDHGVLRGGRLSWINHATGQDTVLEGLDLDLRLPAFDGPATMTLSALLHGRPHDVSARIAEFDTFLAGAATGLELSADNGSGNLTLNGRGGYAPAAFEGRLVAETSDPAALFAALGQTAPAIPAGFGRDRIGIAGAVALTPGQTLQLREGTIRLDDNVLNGDLDIALKGERPRIDARLAAGALDFSSLAAAGGPDGGPQGDASVGGSGWPAELIDASALSLVDGQLEFTADSIDLGALKLGTSDILTGIERARAVLEVRNIGVHGGQVTGQFVINNRSGLSVGGDLRAANVAMQPMLSDLAGYDRLIGTGNFDLNFLGAGNTLNAIMKSLSGGGSLALGQGELRGLDLVGMLRNLDPSFEGAGSKTVFDSVTASFSVSDGVLSSSDLAFSAPLATATGAGTVDMGNRRLNYRVAPTALADKDGAGGISVPVIITGPWSDPSFRPDLEFLLDRELGEERRAVEERLKQEAEKALGGARQEGESAGDALKRRAQEEVGNRLRGLLGGN